jgi:small subunit ribosomal protein S20
MTHTKSAAKRLRQSVRRNEANRAAKTTIRTAIKKVEEAVAKADKGAVTAALSSAFQRIDKAARIHAIHPNTAARRKSLVARKAAAVK